MTSIRDTKEIRSYIDFLMYLSENMELTPSEVCDKLWGYRITRHPWVRIIEDERLRKQVWTLPLEIDSVEQLSSEAALSCQDKLFIYDWQECYVNIVYTRDENGNFDFLVQIMNKDKMTMETIKKESFLYFMNKNI